MNVLSSVVNFTDDAAALEKTLRLFQSFATIYVGLTSSATALELRRELALGRRYFRLFKWYPCFTAAYASFKPEHSSIEVGLDVVKFTFLGLYFLLEASTLTNTLRVTEFSWGPQVQDEANKCWFYALLASITLSLYRLCFTLEPSASQSTKRGGNGRFEKGTGEKSVTSETLRQPKQLPLPQSAVRSKLFTQIVIDGCDLLLPGSAVGWIPVDWVTVGTASTISTVLAGRQIWDRVQSTSGSTN